MGPVVSAEACERILGIISRAACTGLDRLAWGGERLGGDLAGGYFISPALFLDVDIASDLAQKEIFGPVVVAGCTRQGSSRDVTGRRPVPVAGATESS